MSQETLSIIKIVIPVLTFILGLLFGVMKSYLQSRRELNNLRVILSFEVGENQKLLLSARHNEELNEEFTMLYIKSIPRVLESISTSVYDAYIGKLNTLETKEMSNILSYYSVLRDVLRHRDEFIKLINTSDRTKMQSNQLMARTTALCTMLVMASDIGSNLVKTLPVSDEERLKIKKSHGTIIDKIKDRQNNGA